MQKKFVILVFAILVLFTSAIFVGCGEDSMTVKENSYNVSNLIENKSLNEISLTVYYWDIFLSRPRSFEEFVDISLIYLKQVSEWVDAKVVISGEDLLKYRDLINQLFATEMIPTETEPTVDARLYYVFAHKEYGEIFSVLAFSENGNVFVNGIEVERKNIFFEAVLPFLSEDIAERVNRFIR